MYDLNKEQGDSSGYKKLIAELRRIGAHRTLESTWLLSSTLTAKGVHDALKSYIDSDDGLWVTSVRKDEYWYSGAKAGTNDWLKSNPPA
jgi:hypothetical protein